MRTFPLALICLVASACGTGVGVSPCAEVNCGLGTCIVDGSGRAGCACNAGLVPQGLTCVNPNTTNPISGPCANNPCAGTGKPVCTETLGTAVCGCRNDQVLNGNVCVTKAACAPNPCTGAHQTQCEVVNNAPVCRCDMGYGPEGTGCTADPVYDCSKQHQLPHDDSFEADECPSLAKSLNLGEPAQMRSIQPAGDVDWISIYVEQNHIIRAAVTADATLPLYVTAFASDGTTAVAQDQRGVSTPELRWLAPTTGTMFLRIKGLRANDVGSYSVTAEDLGPDDFANTTASALTLTGVSFAGAVQYQGDDDVVGVPLPALRSYTVRLGTSSAAGVKVEVLAADGGVETTLDKTSTATSQTQVFSDTAGTLFLRARGKTSADLGTFETLIDDLGVDDNGDTNARATRIFATALPTTATINRSGDIDVFSFEAQTGHIYSFTCNPSSALYDCYLVLRDGAGTILAQDSNGYTGLVTYEATSSQRLYVAVTGYSSYTGTYTYALEDLGADDYPDSAASAVTIGTTSPTTGRIETTTDVDAFAFNAVVGHIYRVTCTPGTTLGSYCNLSVTNPSGTSLGTSTSTTGVSFVASVAGLHKVEVRGPTSAVGPYTLSIADDVDDHANSNAGATALSIGGTATGNVQYSGDKDVFSFTAVNGHIYRVTCTTSTSYVCQLALKDPVGTSVATASYSTSAQASFRAAQAGTHTIEVSAYSTYTGTFALSLTDLGADDHSDTAVGATTLTPGAAATAGNIQVINDKDVFSFSATANNVYKLSCTTSTSYLCVLTAKDPSGVSVATASYSTASQVGFKAQYTGTYTIEVASYSSSYTGTYAVTLTSATDDHADTATSATAITPGAAATAGEIQFTGDHDVFAFTAVANHIYRFTCTGSTSYLCYLLVKDSVGTSVTSSTYGSSTQVNFRATSAAKYSVDVYAYSSYLGTYSLALTDLGADDHSDTSSGATALTSGVPLAGNIQFANDIDVFSFTAVAGRIYRINCTGSTYDVCQLVAKNPSATQVASSYEGTATQVAFKAAVGGTFTIETRAYSTYTGTYTVTLTDVGVDDHGDSAVAASTISVASPVSGNLELAGDVDWFAVTVSTGVTYTAATTGASAYVYIYQPDGVTLFTSGTYSRSFVPTQSGTYFVRISGYSTSTTGAYTLTVQ